MGKTVIRVIGRVFCGVRVVIVQFADGTMSVKVDRIDAKAR